MTEQTTALAALDLFVGEWAIDASFDEVASADSGARVIFEWLPGQRFLVQRWSVPVPEAPDGIAIIGADQSSEGAYVQHYFDSRGVARLYQMTLNNNVWRLWRDQADFSPLDVRQRYRGTISSDGQTITGTWEICHDGTTWQRDFDLTYRRLS